VKLFSDFFEARRFTMHRYFFFSLVFSMALIPIHTTSSPLPDVSQQLRECEKHLQANRLTIGRSGTALACYQEVLEKYPTNAEALAGLENIEARYATWAKRALDRGQKNKAKGYLDSLRNVNPDSPTLAELEARLQTAANTSTFPPVTSAPSSEAILQRKAQIVDVGQIYELINTTNCLTWARPDMKKKGGKNGWGSFYPKKGDTGIIVAEIQHCRAGNTDFNNSIYILKVGQYYVPISSTGALLVSSENSATNE
jgi:tetratricopeptide (TPR) repeat protein